VEGLGPSAVRSICCFAAVASRDLTEFEVTYLFVDGIAERLHLGQPREAVLAAWGILRDGKKALLHLAPGTKEDTASCREFFQEMRRRGLPDPCFRLFGFEPPEPMGGAQTN
jgi:transposase-like protein